MSRMSRNKELVAGGSTLANNTTDEQFAPFQDIIVTAEPAFPVIQPNLNRIALIGLFGQCRPQ